MEHGNGWIINGYFKLVHIINLEEFSKILVDIEDTVRYEMEQNPLQTIIAHHLNLTKSYLNELQKERPRKPRSINWIGSAWKWIAGSPDAIDWDFVLQSQNKIVTNNNNQYVINEKLFNATQESIKKVNEMVSYSNSISKTINYENLEIVILNKILVVKEQIMEIVRASQIAKTGIVNTNLLDHNEMERIISEEESLPYQNKIEAAEYAKPSMYTNGTLLLYVLSVPKVTPEKYRVIFARATSSRGRQVDLQYQILMMNDNETYGVIGNCFTMSNTTICEKNMLKRLPEDGCDARLLKGGNADCHFIANDEAIIELMYDNTIFITNFNGVVRSERETRNINGTFVIQFVNETLQIANKTFSSKESTTVQVLPSILTNVTNKGIRLNLEYVHALNLDNIDQINYLGEAFHISTITEAIILATLAVIVYKIWRKITGTVTIPRTYDIQKSPTNLRDADI